MDVYQLCIAVSNKKTCYSQKTFDLQNRAGKTSHEKSILKCSKTEKKNRKKYAFFIQESAEL